MICIDPIDLASLRICDHPIGKRTRLRSTSRRGRCTRALPFKKGEHLTGLAVDASVRAALSRGAGQGAANLFSINIEDLRKKQALTPGQMLVVLVVDASDSMGQGTTTRMKAAKGAALALLTKARLHRHRVGVVAFRDKRATVLLPPTQSIALARDRLRLLPTGGATPLADGLWQAWQMIRQERRRDPLARSVMVLISDGEANVPMADLSSGVDVLDELRRIAEKMVGDDIRSVLIDTQPRSGGLRQMHQLAMWLQGAYHPIDQLRAGHVIQFVSQAGVKRPDISSTDPQ